MEAERSFCLGHTPFSRISFSSVSLQTLANSPKQFVIALKLLSSSSAHNKIQSSHAMLLLLTEVTILALLSSSADQKRICMKLSIGQQKLTAKDEETGNLSQVDFYLTDMMLWHYTRRSKIDAEFCSNLRYL